MRVDKWLWAARFFKTRSLARQAMPWARSRRSQPVMRSRRHLLVAGGVGGLTPLFAFAQPRSVNIGVLSVRAASLYTEPMLKRLEELGYRATLDYRHADGFVERFQPLARDLASRKYDLIVAIGSHQGPEALRQAGIEVPVVFIAVGYDPVEKRLVQSLARPGSNFTGVFAHSPPLAAKRVELAQELTLSNRFLVLSDSYAEETVPDVRRAANARGVHLIITEFKERPYPYERAFQSARSSDVRGVIVLTSPVFAEDRAVITELSVKHRLPTVGFVLNDAFLIGNSPNSVKMAQRTAEIVARILKGVKPADIPVQQADEFDLVVNLRTARAVGIKVPQSVMTRATRIVE